MQQLCCTAVKIREIHVCSVQTSMPSLRYLWPAFGMRATLESSDWKSSSWIANGQWNTSSSMAHGFLVVFIASKANKIDLDCEQSLSVCSLIRRKERKTSDRASVISSVIFKRRNREPGCHARMLTVAHSVLCSSLRSWAKEGLLTV